MEEFWLIAGLGNYGREYDGTRHNVGFETLDRLLSDYNMSCAERFGKSLIAKGRIGDHKVILMKPQTYMNLSGEAVREGIDYYRIDPETHLIVISDDIDLPVGKLRLRKKGSAGGHNGLKNIVLHLGTDAFQRVRVGIGAKPNPQYDLADWVLGRPKGEERKTLDEGMDRAAKAVVEIMDSGIDKAMCDFNG